MKENFSTDQPIQKQEEDRFQRYEFAKRIAQTILNRKSSDSLVIGLYGAWGEGKSSVLNFIKTELSKSNDKPIYITFNPWRFTDEAALLTSFFDALATALKNEGIKNQVKKEKTNWFNKKKGNLKTNTETIGEIIQEYGGIVSIFGAGETAQNIGKAISNVNIDKLKERIEELLIQVKRKIIIIIDDIDRLDKDEIHSIFRLVKLTGDFSYTTYLLSFDEKMVSKAISERFASNEDQSGINFLEKIIQIPIKLPKAQKGDLKQYSLDLIQNAIDSNQIALTENEAQEFTRKYTSYFIDKVNSPRVAVRYSNSLMFHLPLLEGEVNIVDFMLFEAFKIFWPKVYEYVLQNPDYFVGNFGGGTYSDKIDQEKVDRFKDSFSTIEDELSIEETGSLKNALISLFPNLNTPWQTNFFSTQSNEEERYAQKRICSSKYFERYISYSIVKGQVSDVAFSQLFKDIKSISPEELESRVSKLLASSLPENFIEKLRHNEQELDSETSIKIGNTIAKCAQNFPVHESMFFSFLTPFSQAAIFVGQLIRHCIEKEKTVEFMNSIIQVSKPFEFCYEVYRTCKSENKEENVFTESEETDILKVMLQRCLELSEQQPIWVTHLFPCKILLQAWSTKIDNKEFSQYLNNKFQEDSTSVIPFLKVFVGYIRSNTHPTPYHGDFQNKHFEWLDSFVDSKLVFETCQRNLEQDLSEVKGYSNMEHKQTDKNLMLQFAFHYNKKNS